MEAFVVSLLSLTEVRIEASEKRGRHLLSGEWLAGDHGTKVQGILISQQGRVRTCIWPGLCARVCHLCVRVCVCEFV